MMDFQSVATSLFIFVKYFSKVLDTVATPSRIYIPGETKVCTDTSHQFYSHAIAVRHIGSHGFTYFVQFARQNQLVFVIHIIKVSTQVQPGVGICIAQFIIEEAFLLGVFKDFTIGIIVSGRFFVRHTKRTK